MYIMQDFKIVAKLNCIMNCQGGFKGSSQGVAEQKELYLGMIQFISVKAKDHLNSQSRKNNEMHDLGKISTVI